MFFIEWQAFWRKIRERFIKMEGLFLKKYGNQSAYLLMIITTKSAVLVASKKHFGIVFAKIENDFKQIF